ncbi:NAD(P)/FAD-dependent oxidoreductase [Bowmanella dokdonensis]|uniref:NAD(P)-binding protein n=1 Tax=Bowmanella dokdonensis TaxID=751969 RepID=A0A939IS49_9ALTE|nr:NAD(P)-binding protein [Bowmanella dokdonensis]MBN7826799.1 NAD(P)-binding protein [Bowmanella dokdonensis]
MKFAIVGAGMSGCLLCSYLTAAGHQVTVFEKSRGPGGRSSTKRTDWGSFDPGASFLRTADPDLLEQLQPLEALGIVRPWSVTPYDKTDYFSAQQTHDQFFVFTPGMNAACRFWLQGASLLNSIQITHMQEMPKGWMLWDQQQRKFGLFDYVVVTAPWPQTRHLLSEHLPDIADTRETDWLPCWSVAMQLARPVTDAMPVIYAHQQLLQLAVLDSAKPDRQAKRQIWVVQFSHPESARLQYTAKDEVARRAASALGELLELPPLQVSHSYQHYWRFARLSPLGHLPGLIHDPERRLMGLGDWSMGGSLPCVFKTAHKAVKALYDSIA